MQLELIDIQCDLTLKDKFSTSTLDSFYGSLNEMQFPNLHRHARRMPVLFGSTYVCEQMFSMKNYNKSRYRSRLMDEHLSSVLRIATSQMTPDFDDLAKGGDRLHRLFPLTDNPYSTYAKLQTCTQTVDTYMGPFGLFGASRIQCVNYQRVVKTV